MEATFVLEVLTVHGQTKKRQTTAAKRSQPGSQLINQTMTAAAAATTLYRRLMREAKQFHDYNFRMYAIRRVKAGFDKNRTLSGDAATNALEEGEKQLLVLTRQSVLSRLYPSAQSVMESPTAIA